MGIRWTLLILLVCIAGCRQEFVSFRGPNGDTGVCAAAYGAMDKCKELYLNQGYVEIK
jgi:hypothetical protein